MDVHDCTQTKNVGCNHIHIVKESVNNSTLCVVSDQSTINHFYYRLKSPSHYTKVCCLLFGLLYDLTEIIPIVLNIIEL